MTFDFYAVAILYAALSLLASVAKFRQWSSQPSLVAMFTGSFGLCTSLALKSGGHHNAWYLALAALVCIAAGAWKNSALVERRHLSHHIVRWVVSLLILLGFVFC